MPDHFLPFPAYISDDKVGNEILVIEHLRFSKIVRQAANGDTAFTLSSLPNIIAKFSILVNKYGRFLRP
jgi:hypothetical protein